MREYLSIIYEYASFLVSRNPFWAAGCLSVMLCLSVIVAGFLIDRLVVHEIRLLAGLFSVRTAMVFVNYLTFPGTILHELSHALFGFMTGARITKIKFFEKPSTGRLGHVEFCVTGGFVSRCLQYACLSCAPVVTGGILSSFIVYLLVNSPNGGLLYHAFLLYLLICFINHSSMSLQDIKHYIKGQMFLLPFMWLVIYVLVSSQEIIPFFSYFY